MTYLKMESMDSPLRGWEEDKGHPSVRVQGPHSIYIRQHSLTAENVSALLNRISPNSVLYPYKRYLDSKSSDSRLTPQTRHLTLSQSHESLPTGLQKFNQTKLPGVLKGRIRGSFLVEATWTKTGTEMSVNDSLRVLTETKPVRRTMSKLGGYQRRSAIFKHSDILIKQKIVSDASIYTYSKPRTSFLAVKGTNVSRS